MRSNTDEKIPPHPDTIWVISQVGKNNERLFLSADPSFKLE